MTTNEKMTQIRQQVDKMPKSRLREYYNEYINLHEEIVSKFLNNLRDNLQIRVAISKLCRILFHEYMGAEAENYYQQSPDGEIFTLGLHTGNKPFCYVNGIWKKDLNTYSDCNPKVKRDKSELCQIASAICYAENSTNRNDRLYTTIASIHKSFYGELSNYEHGGVRVSQPFSVESEFKAYESFVSQVHDIYKKLSIDISALPTSQSYDLDAGMIAYAVQNAQLDNIQIGLATKINEIVDDEFRHQMVLITPANLNPKLARSLCRIRWNLILCFDPNPLNGDSTKNSNHMVNILDEEWNGKRPYSIDNVISDGNSQTAFVYANGCLPSEPPFTKLKDWRNNKQSDIKGAISKIRRGSSPITVISVTRDENNKIFNEIISLLKEGDEGIFIGAISPELSDNLNGDFDFEEPEIFQVSQDKAAHVFENISNFVVGKGDDTLLYDSLSESDIAAYREVGIDIMRTIPDGVEKKFNAISGFYHGQPISSSDLYNNFDVRRKIYNKFYHKIKARIDKGQKFTEYIKHSPSSGASTMAMRLAYDLSYDGLKGELRRNVVAFTVREIKNNVPVLVENIKDLAIKLPANTILLAIIERAISSTNFEDIKDRLTKQSSNNISFIRLSYKEQTTNEYLTELTDKIQKEEKADFNSYYKKQDASISVDDANYVIDYPLMLDNVNEKAINIPAYIQSVFESFEPKKQDIIINILSIIGFCSEYLTNTDNYVESFILTEYLGKPFEGWYGSELTRQERVAFERLVKFGKDESGKRLGTLKTRFSKFNSHLINCSERTLTDITIFFIKLFFNSSNNEEFLNDYICDVFFKKEEYEIGDDISERKSDDHKFSSKLSPLFKKVKDCDSIKLIYDALENYVGNNERFLLSKAQFLYNRAYYKDKESYDSDSYQTAQDILEIIISSKTDDTANPAVSQSLGVLNFRRIGAIRRMPEVDKFLYESARKYTNLAIENCDIATSLDAADPHALVTKAQVIKSFIILSKNWLDKKDYSFCDDDDFIDYTLGFDETVDHISRFVIEFDTENVTSSQLELRNLYAGLKEFGMTISGHNVEDLYSLYKTMLDSGKLHSKLKVLYANRLYGTYVSGTRNEYREKINQLNDQKYKYIEEQLKGSIRHGNINAYEKIFLLHVFNSRKPYYSIESEIRWLKNWIEKDNAKTHSLLWGSYFLATLYFAKVLINGKDSEGAKASANHYVTEAIKKAKQTKINDTKPFFFYKAQGELNIHSITENDNKASFVEGKIIDIKGRKGKVKLNCGLEASFSPKNDFFLTDAQRQQRVRAKVGFRFDGLGLYGVERIEEEITNEKTYLTDTCISTDFNAFNTGVKNTEGK